LSVASLARDYRSHSGQLGILQDRILVNKAAHDYRLELNPNVSPLP
jgi:hypothetical protein